MKNVYLFQPQYAVEFRKEKNYWLPYSAGCIWSYASQYEDITDHFQLKKLFFKRESIDNILDQIEHPDVCGFSCYLWNEQYCLELAKQIKKRWPNCVLVFGGAQTSLKMLQKRFIDSIVQAEGEESFTSILRDILDGNPIKKTYNKARIQDLEIPSPYTNGLFDHLVAENPDTIWAMTLETNRGCPYACTFCDWGGTTYSKVKKFGLERIEEELAWASKNRVAYIFVADANFGIFKERDLEIAKLMRKAADQSMIEAINLQFAKNSTEAVFEIAKTVGPYCRGVTVSVQSMNDLTLDIIKRKNLDINNIKHLLDLSHQYDVGTYSEVILGLPEETKESWIKGLTELLEMGQHESIDVWFTQLLENSELASERSRKTYGIRSILVQDYMNLEQSIDDVREYMEIVNATSTMTTKEMIDCYMYTWMIIQFHITGYSQIIAKYANKILGISYRKFYDQMLVMIQEDPIFHQEYTKLKNGVTKYLTHGKLDSELAGGHALHSTSYRFMFENKEHVMTLAERTLERLIDEPLPIGLAELQKMFIINVSDTYPKSLITDYNIATGELTETRYTFSPKSKGDLEDFYTIRRKGLIKNQLNIFEQRN